MTKLAVFTVLAVVVAISARSAEAQGAGAAGGAGAGATKNLIDVYSDNVFNQAVLDNRKPVIVFFGSDTKCGHCKWMFPQLERLAKNRADKLYLAKVDTDKLPELAADYGVTEQPTVMTLFYGEITEVVEGPNWAKVVGLVNSATKLQ